MKILISTLLALSVMSTSLMAYSKDCEYILTADINKLTSKDTPCMLKVGLKEANLSLPLKIDDYTLMTGATAVGDTILYRFTITNIPDDFNINNLGAAMKPITINQVCTTPAIKKFIDLDAKLNYSYYDEKGIFIFEHTVDSKVCSNR